MSLIDKFEEIFLEEFSRLNIRNIDDYIKENRREINFLRCFDESLDKKIENLLEKFVIDRVRENYYPKLLGGIGPETLGNPEYLAYALQNNVFSYGELRKINLQNDFWKTSFIKKFSEKDLIKNLRERLLELHE